MTTSIPPFDGYYIGLMSGTSCDGIDAALVNLIDDKIELIDTFFKPFDADLKKQIIAVSTATQDDLNTVATLDIVLAKLFCKAIFGLLDKTKLTAQDIIAIGSHGQTIRHEPNNIHAYTIQIADANIISYQTKITTVADFRRKDVAAGGQGAPLVPAFHAQLFKSNKNLAIVNIGGMSNITLLASTPCPNIGGFDTGPGNVLMDYWINLHKNEPFDKGGDYASAGNVSRPLLNKLLSEPFFQYLPPKSTGRELFNANWLKNILNDFNETISNEDVQCTLSELTAVSIINHITQYAPKTETIIICGGGAKNNYLVSRLKAQTNIKVTISDDLGIQSDWIEAMAFAWLAQQTLKSLPGNVPAVTGAKEAVILGAIYPA